MLIRDMRREAANALLTRARVGHIACTEGQQPYVTPFSFGYDGVYIYSFGTLGRKIAALRANPLVSIAAQEMVSFQEWKSVIVSGRYEELSDTEEFSNARATAHWLLSEHAAWWEPGYTKTSHDGVARPMDSVWFRVSIDSITGHEAVPDATTPTLEAAGFQLGRGLRRRLGAWGWRRPADTNRTVSG